VVNAIGDAIKSAPEPLGLAMAMRVRELDEQQFDDPARRVTDDPCVIILRAVRDVAPEIPGVVATRFGITF
jgi:hypothetical protein